MTLGEALFIAREIVEEVATNISDNRVKEAAEVLQYAIDNFLEECRFLCEGEEAILREITLLPELSYRDIVWCKCEWENEEEKDRYSYEFYYGDDHIEDYWQELEEVRRWKYDE